MRSHSSSMPCSALFLLLLLLPPPTFKAGKLIHRLDKDFKSPHYRQMQEMRQNLPQVQAEGDCRGLFDLYLILDRSDNVANNWIHIYSFAEGLVKKFINPNLRISIITYSTDAELILPLTSDRKEIRKSLLVLKDMEPLGHTHMEKGLRKANEQIRNSNLGGHIVNSLIIALTDGLLQPKSYRDTMEEARKAEKMGAIIYTVGVFMYSKPQLVNIAGSPKRCFRADKGFDELEAIIDPLTFKSCTEIMSMQPTYVCSKDSYQVNISGHEFININDMTQVICRFTFSDSRVIDESPNDVNEYTITCPGPKIPHTGEDISLQVSLDNGISFTGNKLVITGVNCWNARESRIIKKFKWNWLMIVPILLVTLLALYAIWVVCIKKPKKSPPPGEPQPVQEPEEEFPPSPSTSAPAPAPAPDRAAPPAPSPINSNPTVIVACCGCGSRGMQENLDTCGNCFHPSFHQMPLVWCHPKSQRGGPSFAVMKPSCSPACYRQKLCLCSDGDCFRLAEPSYPTKILLQPNEECFNITRAQCSPKNCFQTRQECLPAVSYCPPNMSDGRNKDKVEQRLLMTSFHDIPKKPRAVPAQNESIIVFLPMRSLPGRAPHLLQASIQRLHKLEPDGSKH